MPTGLSSTTQPCTSLFCRFLFAFFSCEREPGSTASASSPLGSGAPAGTDEILFVADITRPFHRRDRVALRVFAEASRFVPPRRIVGRYENGFRVQISG